MNSKSVILILITGLIISGCSHTTPKLAYTGNTYNSVSDDIIIYSATREAIEKIANTLDPAERILLVQVIDNSNNEFITDRLYEELYNRGYFVGKTSNEELKSFDTSKFTKFLIYYPTVYGVEHASTKPSILVTTFAIFVPIIGWTVGPVLIAKYTYEDRQAGVSIHGRLVDAATGDIDWIKNFNGQAKIRLEGGLKSILFPGEL